MRLAALALVLAAGCASSHAPDSGLDARGDAGAVEPMTCVVPAEGHCCCEGDVVSYPTCTADGTWTCEATLSRYWTGDVCEDWECGGPCSLPCPPPEVDCAASPAVFPSFARGCASDADCSAVLHEIDCCGSLHAMGISVGELDDVEEAERICREQYPACGCAPMPTVADDGTTGSGDPFVQCVDGACTTTFPADG